MITIEFINDDYHQVLDALSRFRADNVRRAVSRAANRAAVTGRKYGIKEVQKTYTIDAETLRGAIRIQRATPKTMQATLQVSGPMERAEHFEISVDSAKGVFVSIKKDRSTLVPRSFSVQGKLFARVDTSRYPIQRLYGPSAAQMFDNDDVLEAIEKHSMEMYQKRLPHELEWQERN